MRRAKRALHPEPPSLTQPRGRPDLGGLDALRGGERGEYRRDPPSQHGLASARRADQQEDAHELYQKLRWTIVPMYYQSRDGWIDVMRHTIAFNASFFNTHRMVQQYAANAYV